MESAAELRALARVERDPRKRVRLLAIANVQEGMTVEEAARADHKFWESVLPIVCATRYPSRKVPLR